MGILEKAGKATGKFILNKVKGDVIHPINDVIDNSLKDISTTIGAFVVRYIDGKLRRSITFTTGLYYYDQWMEEALYAILYKYNNIKKSPHLEFNFGKRNMNVGEIFYSLEDGVHNMKYRDYDIMLIIQSKANGNINGGRLTVQRIYTIATYNMDPKFVTLFQRDMEYHRNSLLKLRADSPTFNVFKDGHEGDGYTYWDKVSSVTKRRISTIYLPREQKEILINTINNFFAEKKRYNDMGVPHNLKILLYGPPGGGKDSIAKMIASEWNRNLYYVNGGKDGRFIPNAIMNNSNDDVSFPLFLISDIDKYPYLINESAVDMADNNDKDKNNENAVRYKQMFGNMINALDGILTGEDKIIIITTNHIEKFSEVLIRPGRIDLKMEIGYVIPDVFRKYVWDNYHKELPKDIKLKNNKLTIAEMKGDLLFKRLSFDEFIKKYVK